MDFFTNAFFSLTVGIGGAIGLVRFRKIAPAYRPFLFLLWASTLQEACSILILYQGYSNVVLYNVFSLAEAVLLCWQFRRWRTIRSKTLYAVFQGVLFLFWCTESIATSIFSFLSYYIIFYSFVVVLLSITCVNQLLFRDITPPFRNPVFLLCLCFIVSFGYSALVEIFWMAGLRNSTSFRLHLHALFCFINLLTNLVYVLAVLWMPMRLRYIQRC